MGTCVLFVYTCKSECSCVYLAVLTYCLAICLFPMCWFFSYMYTYWINDFWLLILTPFMHARPLAHSGRVTRICVGNLIILGTDNGLSPDRRQAIIWTNAGRLLIGPLGTNFSEILIETYTFSFKKIHLKMLSAKWRLFCLGLNVWPGTRYTTQGLT